MGTLPIQWTTHIRPTAPRALPEAPRPAATTCLRPRPNMLGRQRARERGRNQDQGATRSTGIGKGKGIAGRRPGLQEASGIHRRNPITMDMQPPKLPSIRILTLFTQGPVPPPPPSLPPPTRRPLLPPTLPPMPPTTSPPFRTNRKMRSQATELRPATQRMHRASRTAPM